MPTPRRGRGERAPGPASRVPGRTLLAFTRDPLSFLTQLAQRHGDVAAFRAGFRDVYLLSHPEFVHKVLVAEPDDFPSDQGLGMAKVLLGEGLLTMSGEKYRRHRLLIQPSFQRDRVEAYAEVMVRHAMAREGRWQDGAEVDLGREMASIALAIVAEALLGVRVSEEQIAEVTESLDDAMATLTMARIPVHRVLARLPIPSSLKLHRARGRIDSVVHGIISSRRTARPGDDLLSQLLRGQEKDGSVGMPGTELRDEVTTLLLTGHETVATALTWMFYLLGRYRDEEARLHDELDLVLGGRPPELADLEKLPCVERALLESMRLYPPAWTVARGVARPFMARGYRVPSGSVVLLSQWVMHRHPAWFVDPLRFDPGRWSPPRRGEIPRLAYFPFGAGPRVCIGETFAWNEAVLVAATLARRWRFELVQDSEVDPVARLTLRPSRRIPVITRLRTGP